MNNLKKIIRIACYCYLAFVVSFVFQSFILDHLKEILEYAAYFALFCVITWAFGI